MALLLLSSSLLILGWQSRVDAFVVTLLGGKGVLVGVPLLWLVLVLAYIRGETPRSLSRAPRKGAQRLYEVQGPDRGRGVVRVCESEVAIRCQASME